MASFLFFVSYCFYLFYCAVSVALLTIYDMAKAVDRGMVMSGIKLLEKQGGKSGHWQATES